MKRCIFGLSALLSNDICRPAEAVFMYRVRKHCQTDILQITNRMDLNSTGIFYGTDTEGKAFLALSH